VILAANLTIPGQPLPKERPRFGKGRGYTSKATRDAEARVASSFRQQAGVTHAITEPLTGKVKFVTRFYRKNAVEADTDNLYKLVSDALNGIAWIDDKQIKKIRAEQEIDRDYPRTEIEIWTDGEAR
jgi:Holliday junction resolvase RusA-like endonuclease